MMKTYNFEYTDRGFMVTLSLVCVVVLVVFAVLANFLHPVMGLFPALALALGVPGGLFWLNKSRVKKRGSGQIDPNSVTLRLANRTEKVAFADLKSYAIEYQRGAEIRLVFKDGQRLDLQTNRLFAPTAAFQQFGEALQKSLTRYARASKSDLSKRPIAPRGIGLLFSLLLLTGLGIWGLYNSMVVTKSVTPASTYVFGLIVLALWGYFFWSNRKAA